MIGWVKDIKVGDRVTYIGKDIIFNTMKGKFKFVQNKTQGTITEINEGHPAKIFAGRNNTVYGPWYGFAMVQWDNKLDEERGKLTPTKEGITWKRSN